MQFNKLILLALSATIFSCANDDDSTAINPDAKGKFQLYFDPTANGDQLLLNTTNYLSAENESLKISKFNFIISNIKLSNANGTTYIYPKDQSYFIINTAQNKLAINLDNIPAGDYDKITFGIGVDQSKYLTGQENQQEFWDLAAQNDLTWSWITGYKFINFEGIYTSATITNEISYKLHIGSHGSALDNYKEITLNLPTRALVRENSTPSVHMAVDAMKMVNGTHKIKLQNFLNQAGTTSAIMVNAEWSPKVMQNATEMFTVDHVHNGETHD